MTKSELKILLKAEGFRSDAYNLEGSTPAYDGLVLSEIYGQWTIHYVERGIKTPLGEFSSETEACARMYELLSEDPTSQQAQIRPSDK